MHNTSMWLKVKVVLWKNFIIRKHHWFLTLCEILIPITLFILIAYVRSKIDGMGRNYVTTPTYNTEHSSEEYFNNRYNHETLILYTPKNEITTSLIYKVQVKLTINNEAVRGFDSESDMVAYYETFASNASVMGVVFKGIEGTQLPKHLNYFIRPFEKYVRWDTSGLYNPMHQYIPDFGSVNYVYKGFIAIQMALDMSFIELTSEKTNLVVFTMQEFPYPPHLNDAGVSDMFLYVLPVITVFSFVFLCPALLKRIVEEKSTGIKELMKMMGLKSWMLWLGWFLHAFIINCISIFAITFFMKVSLWDAQYPPIQHCSWSLFMVFLILYCASGITFCFAISSFFNRPTVAMLVGIIAWILSNGIPNTIIESSPGMGWCKKVLFGVFPNMALGFGFQAISVYEMREVGAGWNNLFKSPSSGNDDITMGNVLVMFLIDILLYSLITFYMENVKPGPYGLAKPLHFPFLYICNKFTKRTDRRVSGNEEEIISKQYCKIEPTLNLKPGIEVKNLYKTFGKQAAVNGLSIDIYEGQITALLGHNGAGKTTTMSIITGMLGATSGKVLINGYDIRLNMNKVRSSLGLCPQQNLQFTDLTVMEHLIFFAMLKGLSRQQAAADAEKLLRRMNLYQKQHSLASKLSGGMRRKLSLAIALIGNSQVLILDEPTSGLDPEARREIWDMLLALRGSRTILITTHFMEEADVLGDRIAIMDHGRLICYGTSMFLKNEYGTGYHLTLIRDEEKCKLMKSQNRNQTDEITSLIRKTIENVILKANTANHLTYLLPHNSKGNFSQLLKELESRKDELGVINISMSVTTLEEVFLRVENMVTNNDKQEQKDLFLRSPSIDSVQSNNSKTSTKSTGGKLMQLQLLALFRKRLLVTWKRKFIFLFHVLVALCIVLLTLFLGEGLVEKGNEKFPAFNLDLSKYGDTSVFYGGSGSDANLTQMQRHYANIVAQQRGNPQKVDSVSQAIINKGIENIAYYRQHMIVAAEFNMTDDGERIVNAMYSNNALHGAPISLNLIMNAVLQGIMGTEYLISSGNAPLPFVGNMLEATSEMDVAMLWFLWFPLGFLLLASTFLVFPQMERVSNIKQLQLMCGIRSVFYWVMCYLCDLILYLATVSIIILCVIIYGLIFSGTFSGANEIGTIFVILMAYGLTIIPYAYIFSYKRTLGGAVASFLISSMFVSFILTIVIILFELSGETYYENLAENLKYFFLLFPQFGLTYTSVQFSRKAVWNYNWFIKPDDQKRAKCSFEYNPCCDGYDTSQCTKYRSYFCGNNSIGVNVIEMATSSTIYFAILLLLEVNLIRNFWDSLTVFICNLYHPKYDTIDGRSKDDVVNEMQRVSKTLKREKSYITDHKSKNNCDQEDLLLVHNLEKMYGRQKVVKGISFGVKPGDCFGLLGVNGAGKTTTFRMLTGDESLFAGDARILSSTNDAVHITTNSKKYLEKVGYCPQFDAINEVLTGREMLSLFAKLRGISEMVDEEVNKWLSALGLEEYADKRCGEYSGGNKRKLSMAVALIGNPLLVMLDEPTSGVDPVSRRKLWDTLTAIQKQEVKPSILLTSHSMEECEALCNKLAIMKAGKLECYGTIPELKQKYGQGYTVMLKLKPAQLTIVVDTMVEEDSHSTTIRPSSTVPLTNTKSNQIDDLTEVKELIDDFESKYKDSCTLRDKHTGLLHYHINDTGKRWSELFNEIETFKQQHSIIEDYSISETTLEEVFLTIAKSDD